MSTSEDEYDDLVETRIGQALGRAVTTTPDGTSKILAEETSEAVLAAFTKACVRGEEQRGYRRILDILRNQLPPSRRRASELSLTDAPGASLLLTTAAAAFAEGTHHFSLQFPPYEWLWMIRRLPLRAWTSDTGLLAQGLTMSSLALGTNRQAGTLFPRGVVPVTKQHASHLAFLSGFARAMGDLRIGARWIGKGGSCRISFDEPSIVGEGDDSLSALLVDYDHRVHHQGSWGGLGVHTPEIASVSDTSAPGSILLTVLLLTPKWTGDHPTMVIQRYHEHFVELEAEFELIAEESVQKASPEFEDLAALLALLLSYRHIAQVAPVTARNVRSVGYSIHAGVGRGEGDSPIEVALRSGLSLASSRLPMVPADGPGLWRRLKFLGPTLVPRRPGPVLFNITPDVIAIDWHAASLRFLDVFQYPSITGDVANRRSRAFEDSVRKAIMESACPPQKWLEGLIGRHLRLTDTDRPFAEFDAAASLPGSPHHLLVFCKSYPYTDRYERGEHATVRNVAEKLADDAHHALSVVSKLMENRTGANYVIPSEAILFPVVVTPRPMFARDPVCFKRLIDPGQGPRLVDGVGGLLGFLEGHAEGNSI